MAISFFSKLSVFITLLVATSSFAQVGFTGGYYTQQLPAWEEAILGIRSNERLMNSGYSAEIDYKITPFENYRVEFFPTLTYNRTNATTGNQAEQYKLIQYEAGIKANLFLLSLEADCDCPTFSREAGLLKKGFFVQIAPALSYYDGQILEAASSAEQATVSESNDLNFKLGLGIGLEIGLTDYITLTPLLKYNHYFNVEWENLQEDFNQFYNTTNTEGSNTSAIKQFYGGIKLGIRFRR